MYVNKRKNESNLFKHNKLLIFLERYLSARRFFYEREKSPENKTNEANRVLCG